MIFQTQADRHNVIAFTMGQILPIADGSIDDADSAHYLRVFALKDPAEIGVPGPGYEVLQGRTASNREQLFAIEYVPQSMTFPLIDLMDLGVQDLVSSARTHSRDDLGASTSSKDSDLASDSSSAESLSTSTATTEDLIQ